MSIEVKATKTVSVQCPIPATEQETFDFLAACHGASSDGLVLRAAQAIQQGDQRAPYTVGIKLTFRPPPAL